MQRSKRITLRWAGAIWILLLVLLSLQPFRLHVARQGGRLHAVAHVLAFGIASLPPLLLSASRRQLWSRAFLLLCLGAAIEIGQGVIYHQRTEWTDLAADGIGIAIGLALILFSRTRGALRLI